MGAHFSHEILCSILVFQKVAGRGGFLATPSCGAPHIHYFLLEVRGTRRLKLMVLDVLANDTPHELYRGGVKKRYPVMLPIIEVRGRKT